MANKKYKHFPHYASLFGLLITGGLGIVLFSYDRSFQATIAIGLASGYFTWGIVHHMLHKDLAIVVVLEYLVISLLGLSMILFLLYRS